MGNEPLGYNFGVLDTTAMHLPKSRFYLFFGVAFCSVLVLVQRTTIQLCAMTANGPRMDIRQKSKPLEPENTGIHDPGRIQIPTRHSFTNALMSGIHVVYMHKSILPGRFNPKVAYNIVKYASLFVRISYARSERLI